MKAHKILPNFFIVGTARAGTTSLHQYLNQHPEIFMSPVKEPCFFAFAGEQPHFLNTNARFITEYEKYLELFKSGKDAKIRGESSTPYLYFYEKTIENMKKYLKNLEDIKILIILRNPVERAFSQYMLKKLHGTEDLSFEKAIQLEKERMEKNYFFDYFYVDRGFYYKQVKAYLENFKHVKIFLFEDLQKDIEKVLRETLEFLGLENNFRFNTSLIYNPSGVPKGRLANWIIKESNVKSVVRKILPRPLRPKLRYLAYKYILKKEEIKPATKRKLQEIYREDILKLSKLINRDLSSWLK